MKQIVYKLGLLPCFILLFTSKLCAQEVQCERNFKIVTKTTPSYCLADGTIEITLEGDLSDILVDYTEYAIRPVDGTEGTSLPFTTNKLLTGVAKGTYVVSVRTFCVNGDEVGVVTEAANVKVEGNYQPLMPAFDLERMRKSYPNCATGLIAFNIKQGTGYGDLTFKMISAPSGVATGEIFPIKGSTVGGYVQYTLPDLYPAGNYVIFVYDSCSEAEITFTLPETSGLPNISVSCTPKSGVNRTCNDVRWSISTPSNIDDHYYRYYTAGLYEIALVPYGQIPTDADWITWKTATPIISLPGTYRNYFTDTGVSYTLTGYIRLKGCEEHIKSANGSLKKPTLYNTSTSWDCDHYIFTTTIYNNDSDGFWCYPLTVQAIDKDAGTVIYEKTYTADDMKSTSSFRPFKDVKLNYGTSYTLKAIDASGYEHTRDSKLLFNPTINFNNITYLCTTFKTYLNITNNIKCFPATVIVYKENDQGVFEEYETRTVTSYSTLVEYPYGKYKIELNIPNHITAAGTPYKFTSNPQNIVPLLPSAISELKSTIHTTYSYSQENHGHIYIRGDRPFAAGTRVTITDAPDGYINKGKTFTTTTSYAYIYIGSSISTSSSSYTTYMPDGLYTVKIEDDCGTNLEQTVYLANGYNTKALKYEVVEDGCVGGRLRIKEGLVTLNGNPNTSATNFRVISGPNGGYENTLRRYNQDQLLVADGEYIVATVISSSFQSTYIRRDTIRFEKSKPTINPGTMASYVCADPSVFVGHIMVTGQGGNAPYTYELLNEDGTSTGEIRTGNAGQRVEFEYGEKGETYTVKITDACGNSTTQNMTLADLKTQSIIYKIPATGAYCTGDTLKLNCVTLGETSYLWEKKQPDGSYTLVSTAQNPRIYPATVDHSGTYRVTVTPEYCGEPISQEIDITVNPPLAAGTVSEDQDICVATRASAMSCAITGGNGAKSFQWQVSTDGTTWTDVATATGSTYAPPYHAASGVYYYRVVVTDLCQTVTSDTITITVNPCYIMVNPNLRSKTKIN